MAKDLSGYVWAVGGLFLGYLALKKFNIVPSLADVFKSDPEPITPTQFSQMSGEFQKAQNSGLVEYFTPFDLTVPGALTKAVNVIANKVNPASGSGSSSRSTINLKSGERVIRSGNNYTITNQRIVLPSKPKDITRSLPGYIEPSKVMSTVNKIDYQKLITR